jgi:dihydropteroate synthase
VVAEARDVRAARPIVRVEDAGLGPDGHVRLVVSRVSDPRALQRTWSLSGATLESREPRLAATTTVHALARAAGRALEADEAAALERALHAAIAAWLGPAPRVPLRDGRVLALDVRPAIAGVVNVTPDSFSNGGRLYPRRHPEAAIAHAETLLAEGADVIDIGGESSRPGAEPVSEEEEEHRILPVVERLATRGVVCSVDTTKAQIARAALEAGAQIVNDVSGARDPELLAAAAKAEAVYVLMHTRATPAEMQRYTDYADVVAEVYEFLADGLARCEDAGLAPRRVLLDVGIGFAKTAAQNLDLLRTLRQFTGLGRPVLVGPSRKAFLGPLSADPGSVEPARPTERGEATLATVALAVHAGAAVARVHEVRPALRAARLSRAVATGQQDWPPVIVPP